MQGKLNCGGILTTIILLVYSGVIVISAENQDVNDISIMENLKSEKVIVTTTEVPPRKDQFLTSTAIVVNDERRNPKFGFNLPTIPGLNGPTSTVYPPSDNYYNNNQGNLLDPAGLGITSTAFLIKSGILGGITAIKAAIIPPLFIGSIIIFLIAGAIFFTCNIVNCGIGSSFNNANNGGGLFGGLPNFSNILNRNGYDYYESQMNHPVYQSIDEGYKKYN